MKMKITTLSLLLLAISSYCNAGANFLELSYLSGDGDISGRKIGYTGAVENFAFTGSGVEAENDFGSNINTFSFSGRLGIDDFDQGTAYIGFSHTNLSGGENSTDPIYGYALVSANQLSYNISYTDAEDPIISGSVRYPYDQSNAILLWVADDGDQRLVNFGFSISF